MTTSNTSEKNRWLQKEIDQLQANTLRFALLAIIKQHEGHGGIHGYTISEVLNSRTFGELDGTNATFYSILRQLRLDGLVDQFDRPNDVRKYYRLTSDGEYVYNLLWKYWEHYYSILKSLVEIK